MARKDVDLALLRVETEFVCDPHRRSVEYWFEKMQPRGVVLDGLREHSRQHRWIEKRQAFWKGVQAAYLKQRHLELIRARHSELQDAQEIQAQMHDLIRPRADGTLPVQARSYEGVVRAYVAVDSLIESKREAILAGIDPLLAEAEKSPDDGAVQDLPFDTKELRQVAYGLLGTRMKQRRDQLMIEDLAEDLAEELEDDDEPDPTYIDVEAEPS